MLQIIVNGARGRMGERLRALIAESGDLALASGVDAGDDLAAALASADALIDFSTPAATTAAVGIAADRGVPAIVGTTGLDEQQRLAVESAAARIPVVCAPNMSAGVNVLFALVERAARALGADFRIAVEETHHVHKQDRPSGTALGIVRAITIARDGDLDDAAIVEEEETAEGPLVVRSRRQGEVVGDHEVRFTGPAETLTIAHHAESRDIFARGALAAARWIVGKPAGLYDMQDVLGLR